MAEVGGEVAGARSALEDLYAGGRGTTQVALDAAQQQLQEARADADAAQEMHNKVGEVSSAQPEGVWEGVMGRIYVEHTKDTTCSFHITTHTHTQTT